VFWLAIAGIVTAWLFNLQAPRLAEWCKKRFSWAYWVMVRKYGFDDFNQIIIVQGTRKLGQFFYAISDLIVIDGLIVNGSGRFIRWFANVARRMQTGFIYHYTLVMILGLAFFLGWFLWVGL
jgi:NADH-quinone oxidoreductase subunit L